MVTWIVAKYIFIFSLTHISHQLHWILVQSNLRTEQPVLIYIYAVIMLSDTLLMQHATISEVFIRLIK